MILLNSSILRTLQLQSDLDLDVDYINILPPELLCMVFEYFDPEECSTVSKVCTRWSAILARYPPKQTCKTNCCLPGVEELKPEQIVESNFSALKQHREIRITPKRFKSPEDKANLEKYLFTKDLVENLESIEFDGLYYCTEGDRVLHLPNVTSFRILGTVDPADQNGFPCRIVAPKLREFCQASDTIREPLIMLNDQILHLFSDHGDKTHMFKTIGDLPFKNLRKLCLALSGRHLLENDFTVEFKALIGRLTHLELQDCGDPPLTFNAAFGAMFEAASNLKSLEIWESQIGVKDLAQINKLQQLEYLNLFVRFEDKNTQYGLSLPNLLKLEICLEDLVPLKSVPRLRTLILSEPGVEWTGVASYLHLIGHQLRKLELFGLVLEDNAIEVICTINHLVSLCLEEVKAEFFAVEKLFGRLKTLRWAKFENCRFAEMIVTCKARNSSCECAFCTDKDGEFTRLAKGPTERTRNFFETLRSRHVDCAIVVDMDKTGRLVKFLKLIPIKNGKTYYWDE